MMSFVSSLHSSPRTSATLLAATLAFFAAGAGAQDESPAGDQAAASGKTTVDVRGDIPAPLFGRWFLVIRLEPPDRVIAMASLLEIIRDPAGNITVDFRPSALVPADVAATVEKEAAADRNWQPPREVLERLAADWPTLPNSNPANINTLDFRLLTPPNFEAGFRADERAMRSQAVLTRTLFPARQPGMNLPARIVDVVFFQRVSEETLGGDYTLVQVLGAPVPAPVVVNGSYVAYRLATAAAAPPPGPAAPTAWEQFQQWLGSFFSTAP